MYQYRNESDDDDEDVIEKIYSSEYTIPHQLLDNEAADNEEKNLSHHNYLQSNYHIQSPYNNHNPNHNHNNTKVEHHFDLSPNNHIIDDVL